jgi:hypothetical protein
MAFAKSCDAKCFAKGVTAHEINLFIAIAHSVAKIRRLHHVQIQAT